MKIEWTEPALSDLVNINDFISKDSQYYASRFIKKIIESSKNLNNSLKLGEKSPKPEKMKVI